MNINLATIDFSGNTGGGGSGVHKGSGTWNDPYTVEGVREYIDTLTSGDVSPDVVYVKGYVTKISRSYETAAGMNLNYDARFYLNDMINYDADTSFYCYDLRYFYGNRYGLVEGGDKIDVSLGDEVIVRGYVTLYNGNIYETTISSASNIYMIEGKTLMPYDQKDITDPGNYDVSWYASVGIPDYRYRKGGPVGLEDIGWSDDDIRMFKDNVPIYLWESGSDLYTVSHNNKILYGVINIDNLNNYASDPDLVWLPWIGVPSGVGFDYAHMFEDFAYMRGLPNFFVHSEFSTDMSYMFSSCVRLETIPALDTSGVEIMEGMFAGCESLRVIPDLDTSSVVNMANMFEGCTNLFSVPALDTSSVVNMASMFSSCDNLREIPLLDTSSVENMMSMFDNCYWLETIPELDTSSVVSMAGMFAYCSHLKYGPELDTSSVENMASMFEGCNDLEYVPALDTSNVTNMDYMFGGCGSLTDIYGIDFSSLVAAPDYMFSNTGNITEMIVTGEINFDCSGATDFINNLTNLTYESVESILRAMYATSNNNQKEMVFDCTVEDPDSVLAGLIVDCGTKGWTVTGLTLV